MANLKTKIEGHYEWIISFDKLAGRDVTIGVINHNAQTVRYCHGYFPNNPKAKRTRMLARKFGYTIAN